MILYLSIVFIIIGLILVIFALFSRVTKKESSPSETFDHGEKVSSKFKNQKTDSSYEVLSKKTSQSDDVLDVPNLFVQENEEKGENRRVDSLTKNKDNVLLSQDGAIEALLYEDSSGNIDYDGFGGAIDSTLQSYENVKLIGDGFLKLEKEGLSFISEGRLFRFDFYKIQALHSGDSYIALKLSADSPIRLFLMENPTSFVSHLMNEYREFKRQ